MRYAFSPKPRPKPAPVEPASLPANLPPSIDSKGMVTAAAPTTGATATPAVGVTVTNADGTTSTTVVTSPTSTSNNGGDILNADLDHILHNLQHARQFEVPDISELDLVGLIEKVLAEHGSIPVGKMGSLLHTVINNHSLPAMLKERYGGLKKFLERHTEVFSIGDDHPFNPHVHLISSSGAIPTLPSSLYGVGLTTSLPSSGTVSPAGSGPPSPHGSGMNTPTGPRFPSRSTTVVGTGPAPSSGSTNLSGHLSPSGGAVSPPPTGAGRQTPPPHWNQQQSSSSSSSSGNSGNNQNLTNVGGLYVTSHMQPSNVGEPRRAPGPIGSVPMGGNMSSSNVRGGGGGGVNNSSGPPGFGATGPSVYSHNYNGAVTPPSTNPRGGSGMLPSSMMVNDPYAASRGAAGVPVDQYGRPDMYDPSSGRGSSGANVSNSAGGSGARDRRRQRPPSGGGRDGQASGPAGIAGAAASVGSVPNGPPPYYGPGVIGPHSKALAYNAGAAPFTPSGHRY
jgi:hypothetical protein